MHNMSYLLPTIIFILFIISLIAHVNCYLIPIAAKFKILKFVSRLTLIKNKMKRKTLLKGILCCVFCLVGCFASYPSYASLIKQTDGEDIILVPNPINPEGTPRTPANVPFYAELETANVLLGSYSYCGIVVVSLTSTSGDDYSTVFDTSNGTIYIPISGNTGDYVLLITTLSGVEYVGEFSI